MTDYVCGGGCGSTEQFSCNCWEKNDAAKYSPRQIAGRIYLEELQDKLYGKQRGRKQ